MRSIANLHRSSSGSSSAAVRPRWHTTNWAMEVTVGSRPIESPRSMIRKIGHQLASSTLTCWGRHTQICKRSGCLAVERLEMRMEAGQSGGLLPVSQSLDGPVGGPARDANRLILFSNDSMTLLRGRIWPHSARFPTNAVIRTWPVLESQNRQIYSSFCGRLASLGHAEATQGSCGSGSTFSGRSRQNFRTRKRLRS
jgi:hypothetical protein